MLEETAFDTVLVHDLKKPVISDSLGYESHARIRNQPVPSETHSHRVYNNTRARRDLNLIVRLSCELTRTYAACFQSACRALKRCLSIPRLLIFDSSVCLGSPSLPAAPDEPAIRPLVIRKCSFDYLFFALDKRGDKSHGRPRSVPFPFQPGLVDGQCFAIAQHNSPLGLP